MLRDENANMILRCKGHEFYFFINKIKIKPHFYNENWKGYRFTEFQWLWFLICYEYNKR